MTPLYELTVYVSVPPEKADYLLEKLCNTVEDYGYGWEAAEARLAPLAGYLDGDGNFHKLPHQTSRSVNTTFRSR